MKLFRIYLLLLTALVYLSGCAATIPFETIKTPLDIKIDGSSADWNSLVKFIPDENIAAGFSLGSDNVKICIVTSDKEKIRKILQTGFSLTFLPADSKNKIVIKYPLAKDPPGLKPDSGEEPDFEAAELRLQKLIETQKELQVYDAEGDLINIHHSPGDGDYSFALAFNSGLLVYELKLPLGFNNQKATGLRAKAGDEVKVILESGAINKKENFHGKGMNGGGGGHQGGGMRGHPGGGMPGGGEGRPGAPDFKPFKIDLLLRLTSQN